MIGIEVHGSLGVVLWAAATGHLGYEEAKSAVHRLSQSSLWISQNILQESYKALDEMFQRDIKKTERNDNKERKGVRSTLLTVKGFYGRK